MIKSELMGLIDDIGEAFDRNNSEEAFQRYMTLRQHVVKQPNITKDDLGKIERWARAYMEGVRMGKYRDGALMRYWDLHGNDSLTYAKICKALGIKGCLVKE